MKTTSAYILLICALFAAIFTACDKDAHEDEYPLADGQGALIIGLESGGTTVDDVVLYLFAGNGTTALRKVYDGPRGLASEHILANAGSYTIMIVANANDATLPQETTVADLTEWLKAYANDYPGKGKSRRNGHCIRNHRNGGSGGSFFPRHLLPLQRHIPYGERRRQSLSDTRHLERPS